jgi:hypothetical protein
MFHRLVARSVRLNHIGSTFAPTGPKTWLTPKTAAAAATTALGLYLLKGEGCGDLGYWAGV